VDQPIGSRITSSGVIVIAAFLAVLLCAWLLQLHRTEQSARRKLEDVAQLLWRYGFDSLDSNLYPRLPFELDDWDPNWTSKLPVNPYSGRQLRIIGPFDPAKAGDVVYVPLQGHAYGQPAETAGYCIWMYGKWYSRGIDLGLADDSSFKAALPVIALAISAHDPVPHSQAAVTETLEQALARPANAGP
jgi:hypothetical protein